MQSIVMVRVASVSRLRGSAARVKSATFLGLTPQGNCAAAAARLDFCDKKGVTR